MPAEAQCFTFIPFRDAFQAYTVLTGGAAKPDRVVYDAIHNRGAQPRT